MTNCNDMFCNRAKHLRFKAVAATAVLVCLTDPHSILIVQQLDSITRRMQSNNELLVLKSKCNGINTRKVVLVCNIITLLNVIVFSYIQHLFHIPRLDLNQNIKNTVKIR